MNCRDCEAYATARWIVHVSLSGIIPTTDTGLTCIQAAAAGIFQILSYGNRGAAYTMGRTLTKQFVVLLQ